MKKNIIYFFGLILGIYILAWNIQSNMFLNWDVSQLLHTTHLMLNGGQYVKDFFIPNPPMIMYLYSPPVIISRLSGLNIIFTFTAYIFLIATISFVICCDFVRKIFLKNDAVIGSFFLTTLAILFLVLPFYHLGQREHLLFIFIMPYLLATTLRLQGERVSIQEGFVVGLLAGLGLCIKPQFLVMPFLIELYYVYYTRNWLSWLRTEIITVMVLIVIYFIVLFAFYHDYLFVIIPYMTKNYYDVVFSPLLDLVTNPIAMFCLFPIAIFLFQYKGCNYSILASILSMSIIGYLVIYLVQRTTFYYHILPAFSAAILLLSLLFGLLVKKYRHFFIFIFGLFLFSFPLFVAHNLFEFGIKYKKQTIQDLINFMHTQPPHQSIYVLSEGTDYSASLMNYTGALIAQRFDCIWMTKILSKKYYLMGDNAAREYIRNNKEKLFFVNLIAEDFRRNRPDLVFVDVFEANTGIGNSFFHFNYLDYFTENKPFRMEWKNYRYLTELEGKGRGSHAIYKLQVYKRVAD